MCIFKIKICQPTEMKSWKRCFPIMDLQRKPKVVKMYQQLWIPKNAELKRTLLKTGERYPVGHIAELWKMLATHHSDEVQNLIELCQVALVLPTNTAGCKRGFSAKNRIKNALRSRLKAERLDVLMSIDIEGPPSEDFDFSTALNVWATTNRRISTSGNLHSTGNLFTVSPSDGHVNSGLPPQNKHMPHSQEMCNIRCPLIRAEPFQDKHRKISPKTSHESCKKQLQQKLYSKLHGTNSSPASFHGLPKIHKENVPIRPIMSALGFLTYELSKYRANVLSPFQNTNYTVKNSASFIERIHTLSVDPDKILVSFDIMSPFTCIPTYLAIKVVEGRLDSDQMALPQFILDKNFFVFKGSHFQQILGCPRGSPVGTILANLVMEHVEEKALSSALALPSGFNIKVAYKPIHSISSILKSQKTRSRKRLPEESCTRLNVKIVIVFVGQTSSAPKTYMKEHTKAIATLDENSLLAKHHVSQSPDRFGE
ncbi:hypothetical protein AWC38_SpisGene22526 [Stylophora pistillata]|uniref:Reverse transcriptase domain-containing protein n=1 Tax=Stylophora pistillata TaxID=50429 RepID=A0A2B4RAI9_STYPI|nr:hypothetical protein AWC38_SpisGene22526 [Stylophora pistillata]